MDGDARETGDPVFETTSYQAALAVMKQKEKYYQRLADFWGKMNIGYSTLTYFVRNVSEYIECNLESFPSDRIESLVASDESTRECKLLFESIRLIRDNRTVISALNAVFGKELDESIDMSPFNDFFAAFKIITSLKTVLRRERSAIKEEITLSPQYDMAQMMRKVPDHEIVSRGTDLRSLCAQLNEMLTVLADPAQFIHSELESLISLIRDLIELSESLTSYAEIIDSKMAAERDIFTYSMFKEAAIQPSCTPFPPFELEPSVLLESIRICQSDIEIMRENLEKHAEPVFTRSPRDIVSLYSVLSQYKRCVDVTVENLDSVRDLCSQAGEMVQLSGKKTEFLNSLAERSAASFVQQRVDFMQQKVSEKEMYVEECKEEADTISSNIEMCHRSMSAMHEGWVCACLPRVIAIGVCGHSFCPKCYDQIMSAEELVCPHCATPFTCEDIIRINWHYQE